MRGRRTASSMCRTYLHIDFSQCCQITANDSNHDPSTGEMIISYRLSNNNKWRSISIQCFDTKSSPQICKNCSSKCAYDCARLSYTVRWRWWWCVLQGCRRRSSSLTQIGVWYDGDGVWRQPVLQQGMIDSLLAVELAAHWLALVCWSH